MSGGNYDFRSNFRHQRSTVKSHMKMFYSAATSNSLSRSFTPVSAIDGEKDGG